MGGCLTTRPSPCQTPGLTNYALGYNHSRKGGPKWLHVVHAGDSPQSATPNGGQGEAADTARPPASRLRRPAAGIRTVTLASSRSVAATACAGTLFTPGGPFVARRPQLRQLAGVPPPAELPPPAGLVVVDDNQPRKERHSMTMRDPTGPQRRTVRRLSIRRQRARPAVRRRRAGRAQRAVPALRYAGMVGGRRIYYGAVRPRPRTRRRPPRRRR